MKGMHHNVKHETPILLHHKNEIITNHTTSLGLLCKGAVPSNILCPHFYIHFTRMKVFIKYFSENFSRITRKVVHQTIVPI